MSSKLVLLATVTVSPSTLVLQWLSSSSSLIVLLILIDCSSTHSFLFAKLSHFFSGDSFLTNRVSLSRDISTAGRVGGMGRINASVLTFSKTRHQNGQRSFSSFPFEEDINAKGIGQAMNNKAVTYGRQLHKTLKTLQSYLPLILQSTEVPKIEDSEQTYSISSSNSLGTSIYSLENFTLLGPKKEVLAAGSTEFATLSSIVVAAVAATYRLRNALFSAAPFTVQQQQLDLPVLDCHIILSIHANTDSNSTSANIRGSTETKTLITIPSSTVYVQWSTEIPAMMATSFTVNDMRNNRNLKIQGLSEITLDEANSRITVLRLLDVTVNNRTIIAIGEALAALRQMSLPLVVGQQQQQQQQSFFTGLMRDILQIAVAENNNNIDKQGNSSNSGKYAPIYVTTAKDISSVLSLSPPINNNLLVPIDTYCSSALTQMPGSNGWIKFMESRDAILEFCRTALPNLASYNTATNDNFNSILDRDDATTAKLSPYFEANATLIGLDGKELLHDRSNVLKLYKNLAALRYTTYGDFTIQTLKANYWTQGYLTVQWQTTWPISVEGTDRFIFNVNGLVERIEQIDWKVQGSPMNDAEWVRTFVRAVMEIFNVGSGTTTTGRGTSGSSKERIAAAGEQIFSDLLKRAVGVASTSMRKSSVGLSETKEVLRTNQDEAVKLSTSTTRELSGEAAISLYKITRALHHEIPLQLEMVSKKNGGITTATPAARFLTENVELRGLLNEVIAGDRVRLKQVFATAFASLRAASQNGWIDVEQNSPIALEVTGDSNLKMKISFGVKFPKLSTTVTQPLPQPLKMLTSFASNPSLTTLESMEVGILVLFYIDDGGKISQIRILETRINGMLTPADVVSKWLLDASATKENSSDGMPASIRAVLTNALAWATWSKSSSGEK